MNKIKRTFGFILTHPTAKRHLLKSLYYFTVWQIQSSLFPARLFVKRFIKPIKFYARKGLTGLTGNIYAGLHEFYDMGFLLHLLRADDLFFDIGANAGSYTLLASGVRKAKSIAVEPVASTFDILSKNIALNKLQDRVSLVNAAAGSKKGTITFTSTEDTTNHVVAENESIETGAVTVQVTTVDLLAAEGCPIVMKIDVEGYETEVLNGMTKTLDQPVLKAIIIELNGCGIRYGYSDEKIHGLLLSKNFRPYEYDPFKRSLNEVSSYGNTNTIYCRDINFVKNRLQTADKVNVMGELI